MINGNKSGRLVVLFLVYFFISAEQFAQSIFGLNLEDPNNTNGYQFNASNDGIGSETFLKNDPGVFDRVLLIKGLGFVCTINFTTLNRFNDIYTQLAASFGFENEVLDSIPDASKNADISERVFLVKEGKGEILRYWYEERFNIKLIFNPGGFKLYFSYF